MSGRARPHGQLRPAERTASAGIETLSGGRAALRRSHRAPTGFLPAFGQPCPAGGVPRRAPVGREARRWVRTGSGRRRRPLGRHLRLHTPRRALTALPAASLQRSPVGGVPPRAAAGREARPAAARRAPSSGSARGRGGLVRRRGGPGSSLADRRRVRDGRGQAGRCAGGGAGFDRGHGGRGAGHRAGRAVPGPRRSMPPRGCTSRRALTRRGSCTRRRRPIATSTRPSPTLTQTPTPPVQVVRAPDPS